MKVSNNKIGNSGSPLETGKAGRTDAASIAKKDTLGQTSKADLKSSTNVSMSERAQQMAKAKEIAGQPMDIDEAKVARLQKMIDEGNYKVDAQSIADRLVDEHMTIPD